MKGQIQTELLINEVAFTYNDTRWYAEQAESKFVVEISRLFDKKLRDRKWCWVKGWKKVGPRAEKLCWLEHVVGHPLTTSSELTNGEAKRVTNWLDGLNPHTSQFDTSLPVQAIIQWRQLEIIQWCRENLPTITARAHEYRQKELGTRSEKPS